MFTKRSVCKIRVKGGQSDRGNWEACEGKGALGMANDPSCHYDRSRKVWEKVTPVHTVHPTLVGTACCIPSLSPLRSCWKEGRAGLATLSVCGGSPLTHLHIIILTGLAPQVVYLLHKAAPSASPSARLLCFLSVPGQWQPQRCSPRSLQPTLQRQLMPGWVHGQAALQSPFSRSQAVLG